MVSKFKFTNEDFVIYHKKRLTSTCMEVGIEGTEKNKSLSELLRVILFNPKTAIIQPTSLYNQNTALIGIQCADCQFFK
jgi:hypothetical protein